MVVALGEEMVRSGSLGSMLKLKGKVEGIFLSGILVHRASGSLGQDTPFQLRMLTRCLLIYLLRALAFTTR